MGIRTKKSGPMARSLTPTRISNLGTVLHLAFDAGELQCATAVIDNNQVALNVIYFDAARTVVDNDTAGYTANIDAAGTIFNRNGRSSM
jgi:hypothetical protein